MPQVLEHGMPRQRPPLPAVLKTLAGTRPEDIENAAKESGGRLAAHRPPPTENFEFAKWKKRLIDRLNPEDPPQLVVIDSRQLNLKPAQVKKIEKLLDKLPPEQRAKIVWLE